MPENTFGEYVDQWEILYNENDLAISCKVEHFPIYWPRNSTPGDNTLEKLFDMCPMSTHTKNATSTIVHNSKKKEPTQMFMIKR